MTFPRIDLATDAPPARAQRVSAEGRVSLKQVDGATRIDTLYQESAARIRFPRRTPGRATEIVLINTAGGLTGGDRLGWRVEAGPHTSAVVTTQACEKVYRASAGEARVNCTLAVGAGARLSWLPQETILFEGSAMRRLIEADIAAGATLLLVECCLFGRRAMGEVIARLQFRDRWRVRHEGRLVHAEDFSIGPHAGEMLAARSVAGGLVAVASLALIGPAAEEALPALRPLLAPTDGASAFRVGATGKLLARLVAEDGMALRRRLVPTIELLNNQAALPRVWAL